MYRGIVNARMIRAAARCEAAERWDVVPRVVHGGDTSAAPVACWACQGRTRHRQNCVLTVNISTPPDGPGPDGARA